MSGNLLLQHTPNWKQIFAHPVVTNAENWNHIHCFTCSLLQFHINRLPSPGKGPIVAFALLIPGAEFTKEWEGASHEFSLAQCLPMEVPGCAGNSLGGSDLGSKIIRSFLERGSQVVKGCLTRAAFRPIRAAHVSMQKMARVE